MGKISYSNLLFADNNQLRLGTGSDLRIYHNGSNSFIQDSGTGDLRLMSSHLKLMDASENLVLGVQAGAVAVTGTLTVGVDDTGYDVKFFGATSGRYMLWDESDDALELTDNTKIKLGDGSDFQFYHSGTNSFITNTVGDINIINQTDGQDIKFQADDGSGGDTTYLQIDGGNTDIDFHKNTHHLDNVYLKVGSASGGDLQIYHNGSHSLISNQTGNLYIRNQTNDGDIIIQGDDGSGGDATYITVDGGVTKTIFNKPSQRTFEKSSTTDGDANGDIVYFGGTTSMTTGAIYHYKSDGTWELADADAASTCDGLLGVALGSASDTNGVLLRGMVTLDHDPGAVGDVLFLSTTAGDCSATAPSGNGDIVRVIGYCLDASNGQIYFNPDGTFVEVSA